MTEQIQEILNKNSIHVDNITEAHLSHIGNHALWVEKELGLTDHLLSDAAFLCDVGKQYLSQNILYKATQLSTLERNIVNLHSYFGYCILKEIGLPADICYIVLYHHGTNVPTLARIEPCEDSKILLYAQILHTIDIYTALTEERPYRRGFFPQEAIEIMRSESYHKETFEILQKLAEIS